MSDSDRAEIRAAVAPFERPSQSLAIYQVVTSIGFYLAAVALMYGSLHLSYALTLLLAVPASLLLVRVFIVQHDCGHGSFFAGARNNDILGALCGVLTLAPYANWRRQHAAHHANWNNLDRDTGMDIYSACLTVAQYRALSSWKRFLHRLPRHPLIAHVLFPPLVFLLLYRTAFDTPKAWTRERRSVWSTNLVLLSVFSGLCVVFGFEAVVMVHLPIVIVTTVIGVWLFSVQHRFEDARWLHRDEWNFMDAALLGSSYLSIPLVLHWLTGNIGYHHIHHLSPRVPNYRLAACHRSNALLQPEKPLSLRRAFGAGNLALWDESLLRLVRFRDVRFVEPKETVPITVR